MATKTYQCNICGQSHPFGELCPIMSKKVIKFRKKKKDYFLWGNILLACNNKGINFYDVIHEICYLCDMPFFDSSSGIALNMEMVIDYFSQELGCSPKSFFKKPQHMIDEYLDLDDLSIRSVDRDENQVIYRVVCTYNGLDSIDSKYNYSDYSKYEIYTVKEKDDDERWIYRLYLYIPAVFVKKQDQLQKKYTLYQLGLYNSLLLYEEHQGRLKNEVEGTIDSQWEKTAQIVSTGDSRFNKLLNILKEETLLNKLFWTKSKYNTTYIPESFLSDDILNYCCYSTTMDQKEVQIEMNVKETITFGGKYPFYKKFSIRFSKYYAITFILDENDPGNKLLDDMSTVIEKSIERMQQIHEDPSLMERNIEFADVLVFNSSLYCKENGHIITPCRGTVSILTPDNKVEPYHIYVGYCQSCGIYIAFKSDYRKMLEHGTPLCTVYEYEQYTEQAKSNFAYKSQSILAAKGYNVQANSSLSDQDRQSILRDCIDNNLVQIHDLLDFLNWLVRTRNPLPNLQNAVAKWKQDIIFVEQYKENQRKEVEISSLMIK